ncbi:hypothetical protein C0995_009797 [Termitomyces sp. Mi166|nr:hypothetical protein C0995_009797 [Termitomyces sp. Mi166\
MAGKQIPKRIKDGHRVDQSPGSVMVEAPAQDAINLRELHEFFDSFVPTCVPYCDHRLSKNTRGPKRFDQHLYSSLQLDKVRYRPPLGDNLKRIADDALTSYLHKYRRLPLASDSVEDNKFPTQARRREHLDDSPHDRIIDEACVQSLYNETTALQCSIVAATLEFQLPEWTQGYLVWQVSAPPGTNKEAIADGYLKLNPSKAGRSHRLPDSYQTTKEILGSTIGVWESKSVKAGSLRAFKAVLAHANKDKFPWVDCPHEATGLCGMKCRPEDNDDTSLKRWCRLGPDADPSIFPDRTSSPQDQSVEDVSEYLTTGRNILQQASIVIGS